MRSPEKKKKGQYRVKNWNEYDRGLKQRGSITFWIDCEATAGWYYPGERRPGGKTIYSDETIEMILMVKEMFRLTNRAVAGFIESVLEVMKVEVSVPDHTVLSRRAKELKPKLRTKAFPKGEGITVLVDSTGVKFFGEGEWKINKHGQERQTGWIKLHVMVEAESGHILSMESMELTDDGVDDGDKEHVIDPLLEAIPEPIDRLIGDGAYDKTPVYEAVQAHTPDVTFVVPPRSKAIHWDPPEGVPNDHYTHQRNLTLVTMAATDKKTWASLVGYHERSLIENTIGRLKHMFSERVTNRRTDTQTTHMRTRCLCLNTFSD